MVQWLYRGKIKTNPHLWLISIITGRKKNHNIIEFSEVPKAGMPEHFRCFENYAANPTQNYTYTANKGTSEKLFKWSKNMVGAFTSHHVPITGTWFQKRPRKTFSIGK